ncbi:MFS transporter [Xinfangfangia sp. D13-10-4-6]|uniref:MFS transporter n=1 Tax=Pseudogemmobacter hezensis TaxID=2737662 RepID=UPI001554EFDB|nr:MFS transporter [Pseudogemmobacter hezensis]NPD17037.1 MFS transporter [Pseudogemmobacter hezensis]
MHSTPPKTPLPLRPLLALAAAAFVTIVTEAMPAGLLPEMSRGLAVSEAWIGQTVTIYALGSLLAAMPLTAATQQMRRRPLLLAALLGFALANTVTALSPSFALTMAARFLAGVSAGLLWALLAGYAARMVPAHQKGRAIAVAMVGTPLALSLGVPAGTFLGQMIGWQLCFGVMSLAALAIMLWVRLDLPDFAGQSAGHRQSLARTFVMPGVRPVLYVVLSYVLAHNILYTYIAPLLADAGMAARTDLVLLEFGLAALAGIWAVGLLVDRHLRSLTLASILLFGAAALMIGFGSNAPGMIIAAVALWGLAFGGVPTLLQTALARAADEAADVAQSMLVTAWNAAIAGGGIVGGLLLERFGVSAFAPALLALLGSAMLTVWLTRCYGKAGGYGQAGGASRP